MWLHGTYHGSLSIYNASCETPETGRCESFGLQLLLVRSVAVLQLCDFSHIFSLDFVQIAVDWKSRDDGKEK